MTSPPRLNLHCHLEGCLRPETAVELARELGVEPPRGGWEDALVMSEPADLTVFLAHVAATYPLLRRPDSLERVACEAVEAAAADGCDHLEVRCGPAIYATDTMSIEDALRAIAHGVDEGRRRTGIGAGTIACILRHHDDEANLAVARAAEALAGEGVVGFDVAGDELLFPSLERYREPFAIAHAAGLGLTAHVAEAGPAENVRFAVETLGARRIGHGSQVGRSAEMLAYSAAEELTFEVCITSNVMTGAATSAADHPVRRFLDAGCGVVLGDDNPVQVTTSLSREVQVLRDEVGVSDEVLETISRRGVEVAFCSPEERAALRSRLS